jgi:hypothetical protein
MLAASTTGTTTNTLPAPALRRRVRDEIVHHDPAPGAQCRVQISSDAPHGRGARCTRVSGPRDDVLGYAAYLFATDTGFGETALQIEAVEEDETGALTLVLVCPDGSTAG